MESNIQEQLKLLHNQIKELIAFFFKNLDYHKMVYPIWSGKDVLNHLTFWHPSFARNLENPA